MSEQQANVEGMICKVQPGGEFSDCADHLYSNVNLNLHARQIAPRVSRNGSQSLKKKPFPLPKPVHISVPTAPPLSSRIGNFSDEVSNHLRFHKHHHQRCNSTGKYVSLEESDEPLYDDVYMRKDDRGSTECLSLPATVSTLQEALGLYEEAKKVRRECLALYPVPVRRKTKTAESIVSKICVKGESQYSEAMPVWEDKLLLHGGHTASDLDSTVEAQTLLHRMRPSEVEGNESPIYDDVSIHKMPDTRVATECSLKLPPKVTQQAAGDVRHPKQKSAFDEQMDNVLWERRCREEHTDCHLYEEAVPVVNNQLQESECVDNMPEAIYSDAVTVMACRLPPAEEDGEPMYEEAMTVKSSRPGRLEFGKPGVTLKQRNVKEEDGEPVYDEAVAVKTSCPGKLEFRKPDKVLKQRNIKEEHEEPVYDEAMLVKTGFPRKLEFRKPGRILKQRNIKEEDGEPDYDEAMAVKTSYPGRLEFGKPGITLKQRNIKEEDGEPDYDEAMAVKTSCTAKPEFRKPGKALKQRKTMEDDGEPVYEEAVAVKTSHAVRLELGKPGIALKQRNIKEDDGEPVYDEARQVKDAKLPLDEREFTSQNSCPVAMRGRNENPYRRAASVRGSFMEDSSDDDEPTYYNLLLVKMSLERCNRLFFATLDNQFTMEKLENKARRLSRLWGDVPGSRVALIPETRLFDYHQQLKPVKSDSFTKTLAAENEEYQAEDTENDVAESFISHVAENDRMILRKWIVTHILDSEKAYISILDLLSEHMQIFKSIANTDKSVIQAKDNEVIFFKIPELHKIHYKFVNCLGQKVGSWSTDQEVGAVFRDFADQEFSIAREYLRNYHEAIGTVRRCWTENPVFAELTKVMHIKSGNSMNSLSLEELLHKPVVRFQQITLSMKDLIKSTPLNHPDYDVLQKSLKAALNCLNECRGVGCRNSNHQRYLVKHSLVVEMVGSLRKLRHVLLFSDVLICAKQKLCSRKRNFYETKWFVPLQDLQLEEKFSAQADRQAAALHQQVIDGLEKELVRLQMEFKQEMKKFKKLKPGDGQNKKTENLQKKIFQQEVALLEASPYLELKVYDTKFGRNYTFLMSSDYERMTWKEAISGMTAKVEPSTLRITPSEVANLLQSQKISKLTGSVLQIKDISLEKEQLSGSLKITVHRLQGLTEEAETFCVIEVDSFGHFFVKAKTNQCRSREPSWAEDFDIDLEGAQTLHLLCYKIGRETDQLLGKCSLELNSTWLSEEFKEQPVPLTDQMAITISLKFTPQDQLIRRSICLNKGMFGVRLENITTRERRLVPSVVKSCIEEIEARGLEELGIYRVSGLSSEVERLKNAFNKNGASAAELVKDADVNVLASLLKFFFRELPESLFTDVAYKQFVKGIALADPEAKEKFLMNTLGEIPKCNYTTALFVIEHLVRVSQKKDKNKMTLENLATVFGPTLLHPAEADRRPMTMEQRLWLGASDIAAQATILLYFLKLKASSRCFMP